MRTWAKQMKHGNTTLTFLDLIFSLLGVTTILTVILSVTVGRTEYRLKTDYILLIVSWKAQDEAATCKCDLYKGDTLRRWTYWYTPTQKESQGGKSFESIFYAAPLRAGTWRVSCSVLKATIETIHIETKRGHSSPITPSGSNTDILVDTADES